MNAPNRFQSCQEGGFTLLEILVAIVVLSIGLLGLAGLQVVSLNNNQLAYYRSVASQQAYDIADRIRANPQGVANGNYNALDATIPTDPDCVVNSCTPAQMATADHAQWNANNGRLLPAGSGTVAGPTGGPYVITLSWTEKSAAENIENITRLFQTTITP
jgi:type IV pilus assembly protein PilV